MNEKSRVFIENALKYMEKKGIVPSQVAKALGYHRNWFSDTKRRNSQVSLEKACEIADHLGLYVSSLLNDGTMTMKDVYKEEGLL